MEMIRSNRINLLAPKDFQVIWLSNLLTLRIPNEMNNKYSQTYLMK
jgi:hypothetical protein